jgi:hypothetical protein
MKKTAKGIYTKDASGLMHYRITEFTGVTVQEAIEDALKYRPKTKPSTFWFNGTFCPILQNDNAKSLLLRWFEWRDAYQKQMGNIFIEKIEKFSKNEIDKSSP